MLVFLIFAGLLFSSPLSGDGPQIINDVEEGTRPLKSILPLAQAIKNKIQEILALQPGNSLRIKEPCQMSIG